MLVNINGYITSNSRRTPLGVPEGEIDAVTQLLALNPDERSRFADDPASFLNEHGIPMSELTLGSHESQMTTEVGLINAIFAINAATAVNVGVYTFAGVAYNVAVITQVYFWANAALSAAGVGARGFEGGFSLNAL
jgi:hypothetical protein